MCRMSYHGDDYDLKSVGNSSVNFYAITQRNLRLFSSICLAAPLLVAISVDVSVKIRCYTAQNKPYIRAHLLYYDAFVVTELGNNLCSFNLKACRLAPPRDGAANYARPLTAPKRLRKFQRPLRGRMSTLHRLCCSIPAFDTPPGVRLK